MSRLAEQHGISGNGLAKVCDRLGVPYPPRGFWARKTAGQKLGKPVCAENLNPDIVMKVCRRVVSRMWQQSFGYRRERRECPLKIDNCWQYQSITNFL